jgi:hypothetical protein
LYEPVRSNAMPPSQTPRKPPTWWLTIAFGVLSALINMPIVEKPVVRAVAVPA